MAWPLHENLYEVGTEGAYDLVLLLVTWDGFCERVGLFDDNVS